MKKNNDLVTKKFIFGLDAKIRSVYILDHGHVLYAVGRHIILHDKFSGSQKFIFQCESSEVLQSIALCPSKVLLAVVISKNESVFVLTFDMQSFKRKSSIHLSNEYGQVLNLSLSNDSRLMILHDAPNYNMTFWDIEKIPKMIISLKMAIPSGKLIRHASFCPMDSSLICVSGYCNLRIFRVVDKGLRPITINLGRAQQNYTHHSWISKELLVLSTLDEIILLQSFSIAANISFSDWKQQVQSLCAFERGLIVGGNAGSVRVYHVTKDGPNILNLTKDEQIMTDVDAYEIFSIGCSNADNTAICMLSNGRIRSFEISSFESNITNNSSRVEKDIVPRFYNSRCSIDGKNHSIICMSVCKWKKIVATGGSDRSVSIWNFDTNMMVLRHECSSDIISLSLHPSSTCILLCCSGIIQLLDLHQSTMTCRWENQFESGAGPCSFSYGGGYFSYCVGSCVYVYETYSLRAVATLRGHASPITSICWRRYSNEIATFGSDSVLCIWDVIGGRRILRINDSNCNFTDGTITEDWSRAFLNGSNYECHVYELHSQQISVLPEKIKVLSIKSNVLIGSTERDGDIVIRNLKNDESESTKMCLHTMKLSDAIVSLEHEYVFTISNDGLLTISKIHGSLLPINDFKYNETAGPIFLREVCVPKQGLEDINSKIDRLTTEVQSLRECHELDIQKVHSFHKTFLIELEQDITRTKLSYTERVDVETNASFDAKHEFELKMKQQLNQFDIGIEECRMNYNKKLEEEKRKLKAFEYSHQEIVKRLEDEYNEIKCAQEAELEAIKSKHECLLEDSKQHHENLISHTEKNLSIHDNFMNALEQVAEVEMGAALQKKQTLATQEDRQLTIFREEYEILKKKYDELYYDFEEQEESISSLRETERSLVNLEHKLENESNRIAENLQKEKSTMKEKEEIMNNMMHQIASLQSSQIHLAHYMENLKNETNAKNGDLRNLSKLNSDLDKKFTKLSNRRDSIHLEYSKMKYKLNAMRKDSEIKFHASNSVIQDISTLKMRINELYDYREDYAELIKRLKQLSTDCANKTIDGNATRSSTQSIKDLLKKKIQTLMILHAQKTKAHNENLRRFEKQRQTLIMQLRNIESDLSNAKETKSTNLSCI